MTVRAASVVRQATGVPAVLVTWVALAIGDTGEPVSLLDYPDKTVTVEGTIGGGTLTMQGSNDGTNYYSLTDPQGSAIALTAAGIKLITENPVWIRPSASGGAPTFQVRILCRRSTR